jgi:hypothetical protein
MAMESNPSTPTHACRAECGSRDMDILGIARYGKRDMPSYGSKLPDVDTSSHIWNFLMMPISGWAMR